MQAAETDEGLDTSMEILGQTTLKYDRVSLLARLFKYGFKFFILFFETWFYLSSDIFLHFYEFIMLRYY